MKPRHLVFVLLAGLLSGATVHGDNPKAVAFVRELREALTRRGFDIRPFA